MRFQVIECDKFRRRRERQGLCRCQADGNAADEARSRRDGNGIKV